MNLVKAVESTRPAATDEPPVILRCDFERKHWSNPTRLHVSRDTKGRAVLRIGGEQVHLSAEDVAKLVRVLGRGRE